MVSVRPMQFLCIVNFLVNKICLHFKKNQSVEYHSYKYKYKYMCVYVFVVSIWILEILAQFYKKKYYFFQLSQKHIHFNCHNISKFYFDHSSFEWFKCFAIFLLVFGTVEKSCIFQIFHWMDRKELIFFHLISKTK